MGSFIRNFTKKKVTTIEFNLGAKVIQIRNPLLMDSEMSLKFEFFGSTGNTCSRLLYKEQKQNSIFKDFSEAIYARLLIRTSLETSNFIVSWEGIGLKLGYVWMVTFIR